MPDHDWLELPTVNRVDHHWCMRCGGLRIMDYKLKGLPRYFSLPYTPSDEDSGESEMPPCVGLNKKPAPAGDQDTYWYCPECGEQYDYPDLLPTPDSEPPKYPECPECGAVAEFRRRPTSPLRKAGVRYQFEEIVKRLDELEGRDAENKPIDHGSTLRDHLFSSNRDYISAIAHAQQASLFGCPLIQYSHDDLMVFIEHQEKKLMKRFPCG